MTRRAAAASRMRKCTATLLHQNRGITIVELLVTLAIVALLMSLIMPAIQQSRESARRVTCVNHLKQLGLAMHEHDATYNRLPALGYIGIDETNAAVPFFGWGVLMLPFIEQANLHRKWDFSSPLLSSMNQATAATSLPLFRCPSDFTVVGKGDLSYVVNGGFGWTTYYQNVGDCTIGYPSLSPIDINGNGISCSAIAGADGNPSDSDLLIGTGVFFLESWRVPGIERHHSLASNSILDGLSHTILLTENIRVGFDPLDATANWANADPLKNSFLLSSDLCTSGRCSPVSFSMAIANVNGGINSGLQSPEGRAPWPSSMHLGGVNACVADGSVRFLSEKMASNVYYSLITSRGSYLPKPLADASTSDQ